MAQLTAERLREALDYNPGTGVFTRKATANINPKAQAGSVAGSIATNGYRMIRVDTKRYCAHRLAWLYVFGVWPRAEIDHVNNQRDDNRLSNLREATRRENAANARLAVNNSSGVKGVSFDRWTGRWIAYAHVEGKMRNLGRFDNQADAARASYEARRKAFGEFARV